MLSRLNLRNFKAFEELNLDFRPITLLLGPNNSGKSSIIAAPRLLVQTSESQDSGVSLLLNGVMGDFGTYKDVVYLNHRARRLGIELEVRPSKGRPLVTRSGEDRVKLSLAYKYRTVRREVILKSLELSLNDRPLLLTSYSEDSERQLIQKIGQKAVPTAIKASLAEALLMQNFLPQYISVFAARRSGKSRSSEFVDESVEQELRLATRASRYLYTSLQNVEYLGAMRVPPSRTFLFAGEKRQRVGSSGENTASILAMDAARSGSRSRDIISNVGRWLSKAGIASDLRIAPLSDRHYEIRVQHPVTKEYQNFADVGFGHSQILPVLVGGFNLEEGSTYLVEEPEIHLHPRAQAELGDFFLNLYERGVQSVVETHSEHLILRLQQHVAAGHIPADDVRFYYVYAKGSEKNIATLTLDDQGRFHDEWPGGFFPERLQEAKNLSKIRFSREAVELK